jgi:hypothetical protein
MKITKSQLKQLIKEELEAVLVEDELEEVGRPSGSDEWWRSLSAEAKAELMGREEEYAAMGHKPSKRAPETPEEETPQSHERKWRQSLSPEARRAEAEAEAVRQRWLEENNK